MILNTSLARFTLFLMVSLVGIGTLHAQNLKFSEEPGTFITEVKKVMEGSRNPLYAKAAQ